MYSVKDVILNCMCLLYQEVMNCEFGKLYGSNWFQGKMLPTCKSVVEKGDKIPPASTYAGFFKNHSMKPKASDIDVTFGFAVLTSKDFDIEINKTEKIVLDEVRKNRNEFQHETRIEADIWLELNKHGIEALERAMRVFDYVDFSEILMHRIARCKQAVKNNQNWVDLGASSAKGEMKGSLSELIVQETIVDNIAEQSSFFAKQYQEAERLLHQGDETRAVQIFESLAYANDAKSMYKMSELYIRSILEKKPEAAELIEKASLMCDGAVNAGMHSAEALSDVLKRIHTVQKTDKDHRFVCYLLADMYEFGEVVREDNDLAVMFYLEAMKRGNVLAQHKLSELLYERIKIKKDVVSKLAGYLEAENIDNYPEDILYRFCAIICVGSAHEKMQKKYLEYLRTGAAKGNIYALEALAECFLCKDFDANCVKVRMEERIRIAEQGSSLNGVNSSYYLGKLFTEGVGVKKNVAKGADYYRKAYDLEDRRCALSLADYYWVKGTEKDLQRAGKILQRVIRDENSPKAKVQYYKVIDKLHTCKALKDKQQYHAAGKYLVEAAEEEYAPAYYYAGYVYYNGVAGLERDKKKAEKYFLLCYKQNQNSTVNQKVLHYLCKLTALDDRKLVSEEELERYYGITPDIKELRKAKDLLYYYSRNNLQKCEKLAECLVEMIAADRERGFRQFTPEAEADIYLCIANAYLRNGKEREKARGYFERIHNLCNNEEEISKKFRKNYLKKYCDAFPEPQIKAEWGLLLCEEGVNQEGRKYLEEAYQEGDIRAAQLIKEGYLQKKYGYSLAEKDAESQLKKLYKAGTKEQKQILKSALQEEDKLCAYNQALQLMEHWKSSDRLEKAVEIFEEVGDYQDATDRLEKCRERLKELWYEEARLLFRNKVSKKSVEDAASLFEKCGDYKDSPQMAQKCRNWRATDKYREKIEQQTIEGKCSKCGKTHILLKGACYDCTVERKRRVRKVNFLPMDPEISMNLCTMLCFIVGIISLVGLFTDFFDWGLVSLCIIGVQFGVWEWSVNRGIGYVVPWWAITSVLFTIWWGIGGYYTTPDMFFDLLWEFIIIHVILLVLIIIYNKMVYGIRQQYFLYQRVKALESEFEEIKKIQAENAEDLEKLTSKVDGLLWDSLEETMEKVGCTDGQKRRFRVMFSDETQVLSDEPGEQAIYLSVLEGMLNKMVCADEGKQFKFVQEPKFFSSIQEMDEQLNGNDYYWSQLHFELMMLYYHCVKEQKDSFVQKEVYLKARYEIVREKCRNSVSRRGSRRQGEKESLPNYFGDVKELVIWSYKFLTWEKQIYKPLHEFARKFVDYEFAEYKWYDFLERLFRKLEKSYEKIYKKSL